MSSSIDDRDVIVITPDSNNQDGTQTFLILEPCHSEENKEDPKLEIVDLSAEVKNTGQIAVVSTNSSTGALEITLTENAKEKESENITEQQPENIKGQQLESIKEKQPEKVKEKGPETIKEQQLENIKKKQLENSKEGEPEKIQKQQLESIKEKQLENAKEKEPVTVKEQQFEKIKEKEPVNIKDQQLENIKDKKFVNIKEQQLENIKEKQSEKAKVMEPVNIKEQQLENIKQKQLENAKEKEPENQGVDMDQEIIDDDFENVKKELEEDVDIEEIEYSEPLESKPTVSLVEEDLSQEDEVEEGALFIDDVRPAEDPAPDQNKEPVESGDKVLTETDNTLEQVKNMIEQAEIVINDTEFELNEAMEEGNVKPEVESNDSGNEVAVIHGQVLEVPTSSAEAAETPSQSQFELDSTNTALTLLELAGSTGRTGAAESSTKVNEKAKLIAVSTKEEDKGEKLTEFATLTLPVTFSSESTVEVDQSSVSTLDPGVVLSARRLERLIEGDSPSCVVTRRSVSTKEIADELDERTKQKYPDLEPGRDYIFAMKLAKRLANKIVDKSDVENQECEGKFNVGSIKITNVVGSSSKQEVPQDSSVIKKTKKSLSKSLSSDKIELLKILEDDPDDPASLEIPQVLEKIEQKPRISSKRKSHFTPLLKLHPELEKELALKQLEDVKPTKRKRNLTPKAAARAEHNNNASGRKKQKVSSDVVDSSTATADPSQVTEFLTVEGQEFIGEQLKDSKLIKQYSNKKLSRPETPPLELPMDLILNGVDDEAEGNVKNKIFKATNPRRRKAELQIKKKNHFANVLKRKPQKKRGRPPKKKVILPPDDMLTLELLHKATTRQEKPKKNGLEKSELVDKTETTDEKVDASPSTNKEDKAPPKHRKMREIDRLLGDEGAINLLFAIQEKQNAGGSTKRGVLPSVRRKKKDLILKTKLVKSAVLSMTNPSTPEGAKISLRGQQPKEDAGDSQDNSVRKMSVDSHDSHSISSPPPADLFPFPAKIVPAEASRIIRRHSSSSNYSSRSNSPRRLSVDGERAAVMSPEPAVQEIGQGDAPVTPAKQVKTMKPTPKSAPTVSHKLNIPEETPKAQSTQRGKKLTMNRAQADKLARALLRPPMHRRGRPRKIPLTLPTPELDSSLAAVLEDFTRNSENVDKNIPVEPVKKSAPVTPQVDKVSKPVQPKPSVVYKEKQSVVYKELSLKRHGQLVEIIVSPSTTKLKNALNASVLRELTTVLTGLTKDENCRAVFLTTTGSVFCQGVDFLTLVQTDNTERKTALELAIAIKDYIKALALFSKVIVATVQGPAVGLGVTMLPLFDLVLATEGATFHTPYAKLGQIPEGGATLTMPTLLGPVVTSELLYAARKLTAEEALKFGLVTRVLSEDDFRAQVLSVVTPIATQSAQSMEATKALLRHSLHLTLETALVSETHMLIQHWTSEECQNNFSKYLTSQSVPLTLQDT